MQIMLRGLVNTFIFSVIVDLCFSFCHISSQFSLDFELRIYSIDENGSIFFVFCFLHSLFCEIVRLSKL